MRETRQIDLPVRLDLSATRRYLSSAVEERARPVGNKEKGPLNAAMLDPSAPAICYGIESRGNDECIVRHVGTSLKRSLPIR
jgi:hypothetical protein